MSTQPDPAAVTAVAPRWQGSFASFQVGDPGRAPGRIIPVPDPRYWHRRDTVLDGFTIADVNRQPIVHLRAASTRGLSHRHYARVRQDEYGYQITEDGRFLVLAVADGVSAGPLSHLAAELAARDGTAMLCSLLRDSAPEFIAWERFLADIAHLVEEQGRKVMRNNGSVDPTTRDVAQHLATTALYAVVDLISQENGHAVHVVNVGDTSAWVLRPEQDWEPLQAIKNQGAEIHTSAVTALPMLPAVPPQPQRTTVRAGEALVLMTDGVGDPLGDGTGAVGGFLAEVWREPPADMAFAAQMAFARKTFDDDRTCVAIWPAERA